MLKTSITLSVVQFYEKCHRIKEKRIECAGAFKQERFSPKALRRDDSQFNHWLDQCKN